MRRGYPVQPRACALLSCAHPGRSRAAQDCSCSDYCKYCAVVLSLNVACHDSRTLHVTSEHLQVVLDDGMDGDVGDPGAELSKRVENFGWPVGKGTSCRSWAVHR
jgi:hypothetical protein